MQPRTTSNAESSTTDPLRAASASTDSWRRATSWPSSRDDQQMRFPRQSALAENAIAATILVAAVACTPDGSGQPTGTAPSTTSPPTVVGVSRPFEIHRGRPVRVLRQRATLCRDFLSDAERNDLRLKRLLRATICANRLLGLTARQARPMADSRRAAERRHDEGHHRTGPLLEHPKLGHLSQQGFSYPLVTSSSAPRMTSYAASSTTERPHAASAITDSLLQPINPYSSDASRLRKWSLISCNNDHFVNLDDPDQASTARLPSSVEVTTMFAPSGSPSHSSAIRSASVVVARNRPPSASRRPMMMPALGVQSYRTV